MTSSGAQALSYRRLVGARAWSMILMVFLGYSEKNPSATFQESNLRPSDHYFVYAIYDMSKFSQYYLPKDRKARDFESHRKFLHSNKNKL